MTPGRCFARICARDLGNPPFALSSNPLLFACGSQVILTEIERGLGVFVFRSCRFICTESYISTLRDKCEGICRKNRQDVILCG